LQILDFATKNKQKLYQARALRKLGGINMRTSSWLEAQKYTSRAFQIYRQINNKEGMAYTLWDLGLIYYQINQDAKAINNYTKCLSLLEEIGDSSSISGILNNIGLIYKNQDDYASAMNYFKKSVEIGKWDAWGNNVAKHNIGKIYLKQSNYDEALKTFEQLITIEQEEQDAYYDLGMSGLYNSIAQVHIELGNNERALSYYFKSLNHAYQDSISIGTKSIETNIGSLYLDVGESNPAIEWCTKGLERGKRGGSISLQKRSCKCLYEAHKMKGDDSKALEYLELFQIMDDSLKSEETARAILAMEFRKQIFADSLQQANQNLKTEIVHQKETRKKNRIQNLSFGFLSLLLFLAFGLYRKNRFVTKAKKSIEQEKEKAESSEKAKHQFLANMSHEIRTPMNAIKGMIDILIRRQPKEDQIKYLNGIKDSSDSLLVIINDILDLSKIEVGKIDLEHIPFSISEMIKNVDTIMHFKAEEKGLELKTNIPDTIPQVIGDPTRLRQLLINLVGNAIKFTEKGVVTTSLKLETQKDPDKINAHFILSDTGIGIDKDKLEQVFNTFEQAYSDTTRKFGGTGLGLSICKKLVEIQEGTIWAESKKGKGSQFHFIIPYPVSHEKEVAEITTAKANIDAIRDQLTGIRILLVEDNAFNVLVAREELEDSIKNVYVVVAENGAIAVELFNQGDFDTILMDVQMPVMNGYEATKAIRNLGGEKSLVPIIAMTANVMKEEVELCYQAGMDDFVGKPFETEDLIQKIYHLKKT